MILRGERGFTMLELLVTLIVMSIGMLGMASLQLNSMKASRQALYRSVAVNFAQDMANRIESVPSEMIPATLSNSGFHMSCWTNETGCLTGYNTANCTTTTGCTANQMAKDLIDEWASNLSGSSGLPSGAGRVCIDSEQSTSCDAAVNAAAGDVIYYTIWVSWHEPNPPSYCDPNGDGVTDYHTADDASTTSDDRACFKMVLPVKANWNTWGYMAR
ncbi:MAG: type IV pilus modification protein PilV [Gammaproteobacteria bacterium]